EGVLLRGVVVVVLVVVLVLRALGRSDFGLVLVLVLVGLGDLALDILLRVLRRARLGLGRRLLVGLGLGVDAELVHGGPGVEVLVAGPLLGHVVGLDVLGTGDLADA